MSFACLLKYTWLFLRTVMTIPSDNGRISIAATVIVTLIESIIISTPTNVVSDEIICDIDWLSV